MGKIGIQLYSVRDKTSDDFLGTIKELGRMGYDGVQFAGFFDTPAEQLKQVLDDANLVGAGSHMPYDTLLGDQLNRSLDYNNKIGNSLIICPFLEEELRVNEESYKKVADELNEIGRKCTEQGFTFAYHNHDFEFHDLGNGIRGFDILFEQTDPKYVKMELDCYWASHAGFDPLKIVEVYKSRSVSLHIKDMKRQDGQKISTEIGQGELDINALWNTGNENGVDWFIVEQEHFDKDTLESSKINITNMKKIMG